MAKRPDYIPFSDETSLARLVNRPPFYFRGVTMRVFPVPANLATIREFCEQYINFVPGEIARYSPFVPFVYICFINYGRMQQVQDVGWVAQNELAFTIPLQWFRKVDGKWEFQDFVSFSPFIYVDVEMSEITGREVYGWPKEYAELSRDLSAWARYPRLNSNLLSVHRRVESRKAPEGWELESFLEIERKAPPSFSMIPSDWQNPLNPAAMASRAAWGTWYSWQTLSEIASNSPLRGFLPSRPQNTMAMLSQMSGSSAALTAGPFGPRAGQQAGLEAETMNLKQFHNARQPELACYQALVHAKMKLERFNRGGLLGDDTMLLGDPTGGFRLSLNRSTAGNLIDTLGLEVKQESQGEGDSTLVLQPLAPYWMDIDLKYGVGRPIGWRVTGEAPPRKDGTFGVPDLSWRTAGDPTKKIPPVGTDKGQFRDARAVGWDAMVGPYRAPKATRRVMTLRTADGGAALQRFCDGYLNAPLKGTGTRFDAWGDMVLLAASNYDSLIDGNGAVKPWAHRELTFAVPVIRRQNRKVQDVGFVHAFFFADSDIEAILLRERGGFPVVRANLSSPEQTWIKEFRPSAKRVSLLELETDVVGAPYPGEKIEPRAFLRIEVSSQIAPLELQPPEALPPDAPKIDEQKVEEWAEKIKLFATAKYSPGRFKSLRMNRFTLKQYPAAEDARRACYQALVSAPITMRKLRIEPFQAGGLFTVAIERFPSFPIVETLGLQVNESEGEGDRVVDRLVPAEAFWMQADTTFELDQGHIFRGRGAKWSGGFLEEQEPIDDDPTKIPPGTVIEKLMESIREEKSDTTPFVGDTR